jgi:hypothetical protein
VRLGSQEAEFDRRLTDLVLLYRGAHRFEGEPFVPSEAAVAALRHQAEQLRNGLAGGLPAAGQAAARPDAGAPTRGGAPAQKPAPGGAPAALVLHWQESLQTFLARLEEDRRYPFRWVQGLSGYLTRTVSEDPRPEEERMPGLVARGKAAPGIMREVAAMCGALSPHRVAMADGAAASLQRLLPTLKEEVASWAARGRALRALEQIQEAAAWLRAYLAERPGVPAGWLPDLPYREVLARIFGADLNDLLAWHGEEIDRCAEAYRSLAARLRPDGEPRAILAAELPPAESPEAMFEEMRGYVALARNATATMLTLPEGERCTVEPVPEQLKDSYPWGGYSGPPALSGRLDGRVFLNQYNYTAVSRGWMQMMALHECYPGHHAQRVKVASAGLPESMQAALGMTRDSHLAEGIAHRSETLMQHIFPDRAFPLFVAYRRLHTAVRIRADIDLHHRGRPPEEVCSLYERYLGFTPAEARGQVRFQEMWPGYMTTYCTGARALAILERQFRLPERVWNELLFSCGFVSLRVVELLASEAAADRK